MKKGFELGLILATMLMLVCCGGQHSGGKDTSAGKVATVLYFGAPWCESCHVEIPAADRIVKQAGLKGVLYCESGAFANVRPTQDDADRLKQEIAPGAAEAVADEWRWKTYKKYFGSLNMLPTAVALDAEGRLLKKFGPGQISDDLRAYLGGVKGQ